MAPPFSHLIFNNDMQFFANSLDALDQNLRPLRIQDQKLHSAAFLDLEGDAGRAGRGLEPSLPIGPPTRLDLAELDAFEAVSLLDLVDQLFSQPYGRRMAAAPLVSFEAFHMNEI